MTRTLLTFATFLSFTLGCTKIVYMYPDADVDSASVDVDASVDSDSAVDLDATVDPDSAVADPCRDLVVPPTVTIDTDRRLTRIEDSGLDDFCITDRSVSFSLWASEHSVRTDLVSPRFLLYEVLEFTVDQECSESFRIRSRGYQQPPEDSLCANGARAIVGMGYKLPDYSYTRLHFSDISTAETPSGTQLVTVTVPVDSTTYRVVFEVVK